MKNAKFSVIVRNTHNGDCTLLPDTFDSYSKCQQFVEKMNNKTQKKPVVYIATADLSKFKTSSVKSLFATKKAE